MPYLDSLPKAMFDNNQVPTNFFTLTMEHIKEGEPLEGTTCPVAYMVGEKYNEVCIDREEINYEHPELQLTFEKDTSWTLFALIHYIDHPYAPIIAKNIKTEIEEVLFSDDKGLYPPYEIEEYEDFFNLVLPGYEKAHLDKFHIHSIFENGSGLKQMTIFYEKP